MSISRRSFLAGVVAGAGLTMGEPASPANLDQSPYKSWMLGPFTKRDEANPVLGANFDPLFFCPVEKKMVRWQARALLGAAAIVKDDKLCLIFHAEDTSAGYQGLRGSPGIMRQGYAESTDGLTFHCHSEAVVYPSDDFMKDAESTGGCEIPRIVEGPNGTFFLYYSAFSRRHRNTILSVATSKDLVRWEKQGLIFGKAYGGQYQGLLSKAGAVVTKLENGRLVAARINGKYWMYWGSSNTFVATSDDLINWTPLKLTASHAEAEKRIPDPRTRELIIVQGPRAGEFDSGIVETGVAVLTKNGIIHIYNSEKYMAVPFKGEEGVRGSWEWEKRRMKGDLPLTFGQALFDVNDPTHALDRSDAPFFVPDREYEIRGATPYVIYCTGLAYFKGKWWLYYNGADWVICTATAEPNAD